VVAAEHIYSAGQQLFQQVTYPYTSAHVHLYVPGLLYRLLYPALGDQGHA